MLVAGLLCPLWLAMLIPAGMCRPGVLTAGVRQEGTQYYCTLVIIGHGRLILGGPKTAIQIPSPRSNSASQLAAVV